MQDAQPGRLQQVGHGAAQRAGADEGLPHPDELPDVGQQAGEQGEGRAGPVPAGHGIGGGPGDVGAGGPGQADFQAILAVQPAEPVVVGDGGLQLLAGVQGGGMYDLVGGQLPEAWHAFVKGMVDGEVLPLEVGPALAPVVEPDEADPEGVGGAGADEQGIALAADGIVNQRRGGRPLAVVEGGRV